MADSTVLPLPRWTIIVHGVQILLAVIILGLSAYGIHYIDYNALIFALVCAILTFLACAYIIGSSLSLHTFYNMWIVLSVHLVMVIFWIVDMGLVANLARIWSTYDDYAYGYDYYWTSWYKRDLMKRDTTTYATYYGCLAAGAFFGAVEFALWVLSTIIFAIYINKHRSAGSSAPPAYANNGQSVVMETKPQHQYQQQQVSGAPTPQAQYAQPVYVQQPQQGFGQQQYTGAYQDPVNRSATVSPMAPNATELASPQHTGGYNPNATELSSHR